MKKVLAIAPYPYLPFFSGGQKFIARFFEYLGKKVDLTVISVAKNDFSLAKNFKVHETVRFETRVDMFNAPNHTNLGNPNGSIDNASFGKITTTRGARTVQLHARLSF